MKVNSAALLGKKSDGKKEEEEKQVIIMTVMKINKQIFRQKVFIKENRDDT